MLELWFKNIPALKGYVLYSLISVAIIFRIRRVERGSHGKPFSAVWADRTHHDFHVHTLDVYHWLENTSTGREILQHMQFEVA